MGWWERGEAVNRVRGAQTWLRGRERPEYSSWNEMSGAEDNEEERLREGTGEGWIVRF